MVKHFILNPKPKLGVLGHGEAREREREGEREREKERKRGCIPSSNSFRGSCLLYAGVAQSCSALSVDLLHCFAFE
jgi:hypothetical protein